MAVTYECYSVTPRTSVTEQPAAIGIMFDIEDIPEAGPALVVKQVRPFFTADASLLCLLII